MTRRNGTVSYWSALASGALSTEFATGQPRARGARRLDPAVGDRLIEAAAALLAEVGYDAMSMEAVAARAGAGKAAIYRRWPNKQALVLDTVRSRRLPLGDAPDTGSLRGDLLALFLALQHQLDGNSIDHLAGVLFAVRTDSELARAVHEQFTAAWERGVKEIVTRATERGDVAARDDRFFDLFSTVGPSVMLLRYLLAEGPIDPEFVGEIVDELLLPILGVSG
jgi:AcrR family transcriptional regulator